MDPIFVEAAKYGLFALFAVIALYYLAQAVKFLFNKYDAATQERIKDGKENVRVLSEVAAAMETNTAAIEALGQIIRAQDRRP